MASKQLIGSIAPSRVYFIEMGDTQAVLYGADNEVECRAMVELLDDLGVTFEYRAVDHDPSATREWEQLDGECLPMLRFGNHAIVRGFDAIKVQQLFGWVGC
jgi:glutaredoxin